MHTACAPVSYLPRWYPDPISRTRDSAAGWSLRPLCTPHRAGYPSSGICSVTKAVAFLSHLSQTRKLMGFAKEHDLSYVYLWQLKTPKTDPRGRPLRDKETGRIVYRRTPSYGIIHKLQNVIPSEYWYEEAPDSPGNADVTRKPRHQYRAPTAELSLAPLRLLPEDPFCGVVSAWECDPELSVRSGSPALRIVLDFSP